MIESTFRDGLCTFTQSSEAEKCMFLQFLKNTSNFTHRKEKEKITSYEDNQNRMHLLSKLCAVGYLIVAHKDEDCPRAVICTGEARSGKTLFATFFKQISNLYFAQGLTFNPERDSFMWSRMPHETKIVLIDDVLKNFNFEYIYPNLTGNWMINHKGGCRTYLKFEESPKIIITSRYSPNGKGSSFYDRIWSLCFSDYYSSEHNIVSDFGCMFYQEWDVSEWRRTWELIADCIRLYLQFGYIKMENK